VSTSAVRLLNYPACCQADIMALQQLASLRKLATRSWCATVCGGDLVAVSDRQREFFTWSRSLGTQESFN